MYHTCSIVYTSLEASVCTTEQQPASIIVSSTNNTQAKRHDDYQTARLTIKHTCYTVTGSLQGQGVNKRRIDYSAINSDATPTKIGHWYRAVSFRFVPFRFVSCFTYTRFWLLKAAKIISSKATTLLTHTCTCNEISVMSYQVVTT